MTMLTAAGVLELHNLIARYCLTTDNADVDGFMKCWVEPAEFGGYDSGAFGNLETWQALADFERHHVGPGGLANGKRHQATNVLVEPVSATEALVTHDLIVLEVADIPRVSATGRYNRSVVVKTPAGWRFKRRTFILDPGFLKAQALAQASTGGGPNRAESASA
jgi:hypothetical protein